MKKKTGFTQVIILSRVVLPIALLLLLVPGCYPENDSAAPEPTQGDKPQQATDSGVPAESSWPRPRSGEHIEQRRQMVNHIRNAYRLEDPAALDAMINVPRHWFVRDREQSLAYADMPLRIDNNQTISQPFIVAYMTSLLELDKDKKVLEIGTGSGYQAAVLNEFTPHVYSIEIIKPLAQAAAKRLKKHGYTNVKLKIGDGFKGWQEHQPFDAIIVTCAPDNIPPALIEQLKPAGKMVIPVGTMFRGQDLVLVTKDEKGEVLTKSLIPVRFVPMVRGDSK